MPLEQKNRMWIADGRPPDPWSRATRAPVLAAVTLQKVVNGVCVVGGCVRYNNNTQCHHECNTQCAGSIPANRSAPIPFFAVVCRAARRKPSSHTQDETHCSGTRDPCVQRRRPREQLASALRGTVASRNRLPMDWYANVDGDPLQTVMSQG